MRLGINCLSAWERFGIPNNGMQTDMDIDLSQLPFGLGTIRDDEDMEEDVQPILKSQLPFGLGTIRDR